jgi:hypothetical protein
VQKNPENSPEIDASVTITRVNQNPDKSVVVATIIQGLTSGDCTIEFIQNSKLGYSTNAEVTQQNSLFTCNGFLVPINNIPSAGEWTVKVTVSNGSLSIDDTQNISIIK